MGIYSIDNRVGPEIVFTTMEKKEKPIVPVKPHKLSVSEKAKNFERITAEFVAYKPINVRKSESDIKDAEAVYKSVVFESSSESILTSTMDVNDTDATNDEHELKK